MTKELKILLGVIAITIAGVVILAMFTKSSQNNAVADHLVKADSRRIGKADAQVTLVEFGDFQCPACGQIEPYVEEIRKAYPDGAQFSLVFRHFPLPQHGNAVIAAEASEAAGAQGKFWEMHDALYAHQNDWADSSTPIDLFVGYASELKLNTDQFKKDLEQHVYAQRVTDDKNDGNALAVSSTPTFYLNGKQIQLMTLGDLKTQVDAALKATPTPTPSASK